MELVLAPIHGLTYAFYRNNFDAIFGGFDTYYAPFISTTDLRLDDSVLFDDVIPKNNNDNIKLIPQILSNNIQDFTYFGNRLSDFGYKEINWNLGCPQRKITKKMKGSALLTNRELIKEVLDQVCQYKKFDLTVKIRLGVKQLEEGIEVINLLNNYPLKGVIIHGRTAEQMYGGHVDLDGFETLYKQCSHEVTYNGDIFTKEDFYRIQERFPDINKFMIGRGALKNPFLPKSIRGIEISYEEKLLMLMNFHDLLYEHYIKTMPTELRVIGKMKEFWPYLAKNFDPSGLFMKQIRLCDNYKEYNMVVNNITKEM